MLKSINKIITIFKQQITTAREAGSPLNDVACINKKAAMFGLDARIALAIFGSLSVITGASLYRTIQEIRYTTTINRMKETAKAIEAYILDVGQDFPVFNSPSLDIGELVTSAAHGWKGPYIDKQVITTTTIRLDDDESPPKLAWFLYKLTDENLGNTTAGSGDACVSGKACYYWLKSHIMEISNAEAFALRLDEQVDGGDGADKGNLRINWYGGDPENPIIFYKVMPTLNQP